MKIYNDYMNDLCIILLYEFINNTLPFWYSLFKYILSYIFLKLLIYINIPKTLELDLKNVIIVYKSIIIFNNIINMNNYHIRIFIDNKFTTVRGNSKYMLINHNILQKFKPTALISIYEFPIKIYEKEDCCICYLHTGVINGLCGHQIICDECSLKLNKCPICNSEFIKNPLYLKKILYL